MTTYEELLDEEILRLKRLQLNIQVAKLNKVIEDLRMKWKPKTKISSAWSHKGEEVQERVFFNPFTGNWTTEQLAFRGFLLNEISKKSKS